MKYITKDESGLITIIKQLTVDDFDVDNMTSSHSTYGNYTSAHKAMTFNKYDEMTEEERDIFLPTGYVYRKQTEEETKRNRISFCINHNVDVEMRGVRKNKQADKLKDTEIACRKHLKKNFNTLIQNQVDQLNADAAKRVENMNQEEIRRLKRLYTTVSNWTFDDPEIVEVTTQLKSLSELESSLRKRKCSLQNAEMVSHVTESKDISNTVKEAILNELKESGPKHDDQWPVLCSA